MSILLASSRILGRQLFVKSVSKTLKCNNILQKAFISFGTGVLHKNMVIQAIKTRPGETIDDKNARLGRPLSPHLTVYKIQVTSVLSILHRIAGFALGCYLFWFAATVLLLPEKFDYYMDEGENFYKQNFPEWSHLIPKMLIAGPFVYHMLNGIRHLIFDLGFCLGLPELYATGAVVVLCFLAVFGASMALPYVLYDIEKKAEEELKKKKK